MNNSCYWPNVSIVLHTVIAENDTATPYMKSDMAKNSQVIWLVENKPRVRLFRKIQYILR